MPLLSPLRYSGGEVFADSLHAVQPEYHTLLGSGLCKAKLIYRDRLYGENHCHSCLLIFWNVIASLSTRLFLCYIYVSKFPSLINSAEKEPIRSYKALFRKYLYRHRIKIDQRRPNPRTKYSEFDTA